MRSQAAESLADPTEYENLFPGLREAFAAEHYLRETCLGSTRPATDYPLVTVSFTHFHELCCVHIVISLMSHLFCILIHYDVFQLNEDRNILEEAQGYEPKENLISSVTQVCLQGICRFCSTKASKISLI